jgi:hypothetical protein
LMSLIKSRNLLEIVGSVNSVAANYTNQNTINRISNCFLKKRNIIMATEDFTEHVCQGFLYLNFILASTI